MNLQEFSDQFDVQYNNVTSNQAPGLTEYEKSVFLTNAERQKVVEYFEKRTDAVGGGFDGSQHRQYDFSNLLRTEQLFEVNTYANRIDDTEKIDIRSKVFLFPDNYFLSVNEIITDERWQYSVLPIDYSEYQREMLKPYSYPVKRGAWRLITDKKNCNYYREYVKKTVEGETINTDTDYTFISTWADQKRNIELIIAYEDVNTLVINQGHETVTAGNPYIDDNNNYIIFKKGDAWEKLTLSKGWSEDKLTYEVSAHLLSDKNLDDEEVVEMLQYACQQYDAVTPIKTSETDFAKAARHVDAFAGMTAPSQFTAFSESNGKKFTTEVIQLPMVEIIGKFQGDINYRMRYVRTLKPIILSKLSEYAEDLTIDGYSGPCECELPAEMHWEILERAVTLAKIAWQGGTMTQAQAQSKS